MRFTRIYTPKEFDLKAPGRGAHPGYVSFSAFAPKDFLQGAGQMSQSLAQVYLHRAFSTKDRRPFLLDSTLRNDAHKFLGGTCKQLDSPILRVGGVGDHVHILCRLGRTLTVSGLVKELKRESSRWIKTKDSGLNDFHWQNGYGAFSIRPSHINALTTYIDNQHEHHRKESFQDEFRRLLRHVTQGALRDPRH